MLESYHVYADSLMLIHSLILFSFIFVGSNSILKSMKITEWYQNTNYILVMKRNMCIHYETEQRN